MNRTRKIILVGGAALWPLLALAAPSAFPAEAPPDLTQPTNEERAVREALAKRDYDAAAKLLKAEAAKGNADASNLLGELFLSGRGVKASVTEALACFQTGADAGHPGAQLNLALLLLNGSEGVPKDEDRARFLIGAAAEAGHPGAQFSLGKLIERAGTTDADAAEARGWYEKSAAQNYPDGLVALARCLDLGIAGEADPVKGTECLRRAADAGSAIAMNEMGVRYQKGVGIPADKTAAVGWFTIGAQLGSAAALMNLGNCYETGTGVRQDYDQAGRHYSAAARQSFGPAEFLLAQMIEQGRGTKPNLVNAYVLYTRAARRRNEEAGKRAESIKAKLTPAQLEEAGKLLQTGTMP